MALLKEQHSGLRAERSSQLEQISLLQSFQQEQELSKSACKDEALEIRLKV